MNEFKDIIGFEGLYTINEKGVVKSQMRIVKCGTGSRIVPEKIKKHSKHIAGYTVVNLFNESKCCPMLLHRLIAIHFIPNPNGLCDVNHKNGIKTDNRIENLEWCTPSENNFHAYRFGLKRRLSPMKGKMNEQHSRSKPIAQYSREGEFIKNWPCSREINRVLGFNHHNVRNCANGRVKSANGFTWKFI